MSAAAVGIQNYQPPFNPYEKFVELSLNSRMFGLISDWLASKEGWTPNNIRNLGFDVAPIPSSDQGLDPVCYRIKLEAAKLRDLEVFRATPGLKTETCRRLQSDLIKYLGNELQSDPDNEVLLEMACSLFPYNNSEIFELTIILEKVLAGAHLNLLKKIFDRVPYIPLKMKRDLLHYPFDQSVGVKDSLEKKKYRDIMLLLDPNFKIPRWLINKDIKDVCSSAGC